MSAPRSNHRQVSLKQLAKSIPSNDSRRRAAPFHDLLIAVAMRATARPISSRALLTFAGTPDKVEKDKDSEVWEYTWVGEHCGHEYSGTTPFVIKKGRVVGVKR